MPPSRRIFLSAFASLIALPVVSAPAPPPAASTPTTTETGLTLLDGEAFMLRGSERFALAEGVAMLPDDILVVPAETRLARLEFSDGATLALGPGSQALLAPRLPGDRSGARVYLLAGWAKLTAPKDVKATLLSPALDAWTTGGIVVMSVQSTATLLFAEAGETVLRHGTKLQALKTGELLSLAASDGAKPEVTNRPTPAFVAALPRAFMDALPSRAAKFKDHPTPPRKLGPLAYADAQPWIDAEPALRRAYLPRWRGLARDPEFRRGLVAGLKSHPEWSPILFPPTPTLTQQTPPKLSNPPVHAAPVPKAYP